MPLIRIESIETEFNITKILEELSRRISEQTAFPSNRIIISWQFIKTGHLLRHGRAVTELFDENNEIIVTITLSERNSEHEIKKLAAVAAASLGDILGFDPKRISVILDIKKQNGLYVANKFI